MTAPRPADGARQEPRQQGVAPRPDGRDDLGTYLDDVARRLPGSGGDRRDVLDELHDGLLEATDTHRRAGLAADAATRAAIAEFGAPALVAAAHAPELALRQVRRSALTILAVLLTSGVAWLAYETLVGVSTAYIPEAGWSRQAFLLATETVRVIAGLPLLGAAVLLLAATRLRLDDGRHRRVLTWLAGFVTVASCLSVLNLAAIMVTGSPAMPVGSRVLVGVPAVAACAWALRESLRAARHCLTPVTR